MISSSSSFRNTKKFLFRELLSRFYCHLQLLKGVPFPSLNGTQFFEKSLDCLKRLHPVRNRVAIKVNSTEKAMAELKSLGKILQE